MPIPSSINDLSQTAGSNSPAGSESPSLIDDYLRTYASYIALLRDQKLARTNIRGTVSQSGGVPTGSIIEDGSNANGRFTKFADGTMICTRDIALGGVAVTSANGSVFVAVITGYPYAATFTASPAVSFSVISPGGAMWASGGSAFPGSSSTQAIALINPTSTSVTVSLQFIAVGRWF